MADGYVIEGVDELLDALDEAPEIAEPHLVRAMARSLEAINGRVAEYPPSSEANRPRSYRRGGNNRWYERGYGSKRARRDGTIKGYPTSRFLGRQWADEVGVAGVGVVVGTIGNSAPYANAVQGRGQQARYHARRGWPTLEGALEDSLGDIDAAFGEAAEATLDEMARR